MDDIPSQQGPPYLGSHRHLFADVLTPCLQIRQWRSSSRGFVRLQYLRHEALVLGLRFVGQHKCRFLVWICELHAPTQEPQLFHSNSWQERHATCELEYVSMQLKQTKSLTNPKICITFRYVNSCGEMFNNFLIKSTYTTCIMPCTWVVSFSSVCKRIP